MVKAHLNPRLLGWAIKRAGLEVAELGVAFKKPPETIEAWRDGSDAPTFKQAQKLAKKLRIPFGYLFLDAPPDEELPIPDFRRLHGVHQRQPSIDLRDVIADVLRRQDWYRDYRLDSDEEPLEFVSSFGLTDPTRDVARDIATHLSFEDIVRREPLSGNFLRAFVSQVEALGILVMRSGIVRQTINRPLKADEFRGFSIADRMAPVIFINSVDSKAAQAFTLAHELAHIWLGKGGISDADITIVDDSSANIESFCNEVAGELLLPWESLNEQWMARTTPLSTTALKGFVEATARQCHVSTVMVARQLWAHNAIEREQFFDLYEIERAKWKTKAKKGMSGGDYYTSVPIRNSHLFTRAILESVGESETSIRYASRLLGVKPANLPKLQESMGTA